MQQVITLRRESLLVVLLGGQPILNVPIHEPMHDLACLVKVRIAFEASQFA